MFIKMLCMNIVESWVSIKHGKWEKKITRNPTILKYVTLISWYTEKTSIFPY